MGTDVCPENASGKLCGTLWYYGQIQQHQEWVQTLCGSLHAAIDCDRGTDCRNCVASIACMTEKLDDLCNSGLLDEELFYCFCGPHTSYSGNRCPDGVRCNEPAANEKISELEDLLERIVDND